MQNPFIPLTIALSVAAPLLLTGCEAGGDADAPTTPVAATEDHAGDEHGDHDHSGWWCAEHGVPEGECARCAPALVAEFKAKGDWCGEHDRPESQCFLCDPSRSERFEAMYVARFGEEPPEPTE